MCFNFMKMATSLSAFVVFNVLVIAFDYLVAVPFCVRTWWPKK